MTTLWDLPSDARHHLQRNDTPNWQQHKSYKDHHLEYHTSNIIILALIIQFQDDRIPLKKIIYFNCIKNFG